MRISKKKLWWTSMLIWMAFNIAVVGTIGYFFISHRAIFDDIRHEEIKGNFREMKEFRPQIHNKYRNNIKPLMEENRLLRVQFLGELIKPDPDYASLTILRDSIEVVTQKISNNFYNEMVEMRKNLSVDEAKQFYGHQLNMLKRSDRHPQDMDGIGPPPEETKRGPRDRDSEHPRRNRKNTRTKE